MSAEMVREIATLGLSSAEAFFAVTVHREAATGRILTQVTNMAPDLTAEEKQAVQVHLAGLAATLRAAYSKGERT